MINVTKLLTGLEAEGDHLRYAPQNQSRHHGAAAGMGPVVVWNMTRSCNLSCLHCYAEACKERDPAELTLEESLRFIDDLSAFRVPVLLFSGGEPLMHKDLFQLLEYASSKGIRPVVSTNGTLITPAVAKRLKDAGTGYVGVSIDGVAEGNDRFRGQTGAYERAITGIRNCLEIGQKAGLRFTISRHTYNDLPKILDLIEEESIPRACFYHLVYSGRGQQLQQEDVTRKEARNALDLIIAKTMELRKKERSTEILTVDNHADGVYLYNWMKARDEHQAAHVLDLLRRNGGNRSGSAIGCVDWHGNVYPDQFTRDVRLGSIRERPFSEIWTDLSHPVTAGLRNRKPLLKGRCSECGWLDICNGNFRARASVSGDFWASDPSCYLTDGEIGLVRN
ncbi:radical SAM/SPASM domain-containing protein [Gorillibacterium massiliense]|uniref:radical SAM/SPASM domain-containing protein n=1 Tax=Gorillibacterium massiliense TaxID=1280390 RepID=UPI000592B82F|nr:radical SAM protein [Gorillibacterium massiliense]